ncbi:unnamed protein product [Brassica napus]|uniref:(rape) hypothetical protein n=1 Tax=Brassica napus TaxID=3708 RepID=A0A817B675_BRANA|nr:unnamed protein product [Brassica napus]
MNEDKCITAIILSMLTTEVERVDVNVVKSVTLAENTAAKFASFDTTVMVSIQNLLNNFKEEVIHSVMQINSSANATTQPTRPNRDSNDEIIAQVMGNLSQHSTLPHNASVCPAQAGQIVHISSRQPFGSQTEVPYLDCTTLSANSQTHTKDGSKMTVC